MTYCLGVLLSGGLVLASDSRSNAGVDQVQKVSKLALIVTPGERVIAIQSAGNLATSQSVVTQLKEALGSFDVGDLITLEDGDAYWRALREDYSKGLTSLVDRLPAPPHQP